MDNNVKRYWGSKRKKIYHDAKAKSEACGAEYVTPENLIRFRTRPLAERAEFVPCKRCFRQKGGDS